VDLWKQWCCAVGVDVSGICGKVVGGERMRETSDVVVWDFQPLCILLCYSNRL